MSSVERNPGDLWQQHPLFRFLGAQRCAELALRFPARVYAPAEAVHGAGTPAVRMRVLLAGTVRVFHRADDGRELLVKLLRAPNTFNEIEALHRLPLLESVAAVDRAVVAEIPIAEYEQLMLDNPRLAVGHLRHMAGAFCVAARNEQQAFAPLEQRMANLLLSYADFYRPSQDGNQTIGVPLSLNDIARALGAVRRSVARVFAAWRDADLVRKNGDSFAICNVAALETLARPLRGSLCYQLGMPLDALRLEAVPTVAEVEITGAGRLCGQVRAVGEELLVGRREPATLVLPDETVSPQHCRIFRAATGGRYWVEDLKSLNQTRVNDQPVRRAVLHDGDRLQLGGTGLIFRQRPEHRAQRQPT